MVEVTHNISETGPSAVYSVKRSSFQVVYAADKSFLFAGYSAVWFEALLPAYGFSNFFRLPLDLPEKP